MWATDYDRQRLSYANLRGPACLRACPATSWAAGGGLSLCPDFQSGLQPLSIVVRLTSRWMSTGCLSTEGLRGVGACTARPLPSPVGAHVGTHMLRVCVRGSASCRPWGLLRGVLPQSRWAMARAVPELSSRHHLLHGALQGAAFHLVTWQVSPCLRNHGTPDTGRHPRDGPSLPAPWPGAHDAALCSGHGQFPITTEMTR